METEEQEMDKREPVVAFPRTPGIIGIDSYKKFAVLMPVISSENGLSVVFEVRAAKLKSQPGEVCFPGGSLEPGESEAEAAVRETAEELLVPRESVRLLTQGDIFLHPGSLAVYPFLGLLEQYEGTSSGDEVEQVFTVPLAWLMEQTPETYRVSVRMEPREDFPYGRIPDGKGYAWRAGSYEVKFYQYGDKVIWGMTARMLESMLGLLKTRPELLAALAE